MDSSNWMKNKKSTINPGNIKDHQCFQCAITVTLNQEEMEKHPERITKIKPFIEKYVWEGINNPSEKDDWKKIKKNSLMVALNVLYAKKEKIYLPIFQNITQIVKNKLFI